ncbi:MAG: gliding motility-associated C-terminal domain-containing protein [Saprospiraceae bacterium]|nr:gliding motility-associated C-terminal domain-containing protein [Saprospiraceae bacterium]
MMSKFYPTQRIGFQYLFVTLLVSGLLSGFQLYGIHPDAESPASRRAHLLCPPEFQNVPASVSVECDQVPPIPNNVTATSCCAIVSLTVAEDKHVGLICGDDYTLTRTWTAVDACGNSSTTQQIVKVVDTTPPWFINPPADISGECNGIPPPPPIQAADNCDQQVFGIMVETKNPGPCVGTFNLTRLYVIRDNCDNANTHVQIVTIKDSQPPAFTQVPPHLTISCTDPVPPAIPGIHVQAQDACNPNVIITQSESETPGSCPVFYTLTRTFTANDGCGNTVTATQTITVMDNDPPVISNVPAELTVTCEPPVPESPVATDECDPNVTLEVLDVVLSGGGCGEDQVILRTWTATDECGNTATATQIVTVKVMGEIVFNMDPADITVNCSDIPDPAVVTANDFCGLPLQVMLEEDELPGNCHQQYTLVRTWTATDPCGNTDSRQQSITLRDLQAPVISSMPANLTVDCGDIPDPILVTATDNCDPDPQLTFTESVAGNVCQPQIITRTWTAFDDCGNGTQVIQQIYVLDDEPPVILNPPADLTISCAIGPPPVPSINVSDDCGSGNVTVDYQEFLSGDVCDPQMLGRVWTVTDQCGNTAIHAQMVTILDDAPPIVIAPDDVTVNCDEVPALEDPIISDDCDNNPVVQYTEMAVPGSCPVIYTLMRTWKVTDQCGNMATTTQNVVVVDTKPPVLEFIHPLLAGLMDGDTFKIACDKPVIFDLEDVSVTDNCDPDPMLWMEEELIETGPCIIFMRCTFVAKDSCGNIGTLTFYYLIGDDVPPVLHGVPDDLTLECDQPVPPPAQVTATDNCTQNVVVQFHQDSLPGNCPYNYMILRTWTGIDECDNQVTHTQKITVQDTRPPTWMPMHPILIGVESGDTLVFECDGIVLLNEDDLPAKDNCDPDIQVTFDEVITEGDCLADGFKIWMECTWYAIDDCGNDTTFVIYVMVTDTTPPVLSSGKKDITISCDDPIPSPPQLTALDNCDGPVPVHELTTVIPGPCPHSYSIRTVCWAEDACGNRSEQMQTITVVDDEPPVFIQVPQNLTVECDDPILEEDPEVVDNCGEVTLTLEEKEANGPCTDAYLLIREWTATDECGNTSTATQIITVQDLTPPVFDEIPEPVTVECDQIPQPEDVDATDNCDPDVAITFTEQVVPGSCPDHYTLLRVWMATDDCGNSTTAEQSIQVQDTKPPVLSGIPASLTIECNDPIPPVAVVTAQDNCDPDPDILAASSISPGQCPDEFIIARSWTAIDRCGNSATGTQIIHIVDTEAPVFVQVPPQLTLECDEVIPPGQPDVVDNCDPDPVITLQESTLPGTCEHEYTLIRTWIATDACGNSQTAQQIIKVHDNTPPVLTPVHPGLSGVASGDTIYFECDNITIFDVDDVTASDNCDDDPEVAFHEVETQGDCLQDGFFLQLLCTWTATDDCGNTSSYFIIVRITDHTPPVIKGVPADVTLECDQPLPPVSGVFAEDNCSENIVLTMTEQTTIGTCKHNYVVTRTWTATDECGNTATAQQKITVQDTTPPEIHGVPEDITLECDQPLPDPADVHATDNCDTDPVLEYKEAREDGNCPQEYVLLRIWSAEDACGNVSVSTQKITVVDTKAPILIGVPGSVTVECDNIPSPATVKAVDACDTLVTVVYNQQRVNGPCPDTYTLIRTWTATDDCGNTATGSQTISVVDTHPPVISGVPASVTIECDQPIPGPGNPVATDNCDPAPDLELDVQIVAGNCPQSYVMVRTWTATDRCGHTSTASQTITIRDTEAPVFVQVPPNLTLECDEVIPPGQPDVVDNCDPDPVITLQESTLPGTCEHEYTLLRTWTATDACGNSQSAQQIVKVYDNTPPVLTPVHPGLSGVASGDTLYFECDNITIFDVDDVTVSDNCDDDPTVTFHEVETQGDCLQDGFFLQLLCTWTATDDCGNTSSYFIIVRITDHTPPVIKGVPADVTLECDQPLPPVSGVFAEDNCSENVVLTLTEQTTIGSCKHNYVVTRTWTATDECGNTATAQQKVTVQDTTPPEIHGVPEDITLECDQPLPDPADVYATDNCDTDPVLQYKEVREVGNCPQEYVLLRIWSAEDACGNSSVQTQKISVVDTHAPILIGVPGSVTVECDEVPPPGNVKAVDACDSVVTVIYNQQRVNGPCPDTYTLIRTWTATDDCGNSVTGTQTISVIDTVAPMFTQLPEDLTLDCALPLPPVEFEAVDNCTQNLTVVITLEGGKACDSIVDQRIIRVKDACGNEAVAIQDILLLDTTPPFFKPFDAKVYVPCEDWPDIPPPPAMDNCDEDVEITWEDITTPGGCPQEFTVLRTWTATDDCGNTATAIQLIGVVDEEAPVLIPKVPILEGVPSGSTITLECDEVQVLDEGAFMAMDNCDPDPEIIFEEEILTGDCVQDGYFLKMICTWTAIDACGNSSSYTIMFLVTDTEPPYFTYVPDPLTIECLDPVPFIPAEADDDCAAITVQHQDSTTNLDCGYQIIRTFTATDACGHSATATQRILVTDTTAPYFLNQVDDVTVHPDLGEPIPPVPTVAADDACSDVEIQYSQDTLAGPDCGYILQRSWIATDACDNSAILVQRITVWIACPCVLPEVENILLDHPDCGQNNGTITIETVEDPSQYSWLWLPDKGQPNAAGNQRTGLGSGIYAIFIEDPKALNCFVKLDVILEDQGSCLDTVFATIPMDAPFTLCIDQVLDFDPPVGQTSICGQDPNLEVSVTNGSHCVVLDPEDGFTGTATVCVVHCDTLNPPFCDTTIIVVQINAVAPCDPMIPDASTPLSSPDCELAAMVCFPIPAANILQYEILVDGAPYTGSFDTCEGGGTALLLMPGDHQIEVTHVLSLCLESATLSITCPDDDVLIAVDDQSKLRKNRTVEIPVLLNDIIPAGYTIEDLAILSHPSQGVVQVTTGNTVIYTPVKDYCGQDMFVYQICIEPDVCDDAVVMIDVDCSGLVVHTGFSPNGDNINDKFTVTGIEDYPNNEVTVYNRWGNQVFYQKGYKNSWDGSWNGYILPDGTYFYFLKDGEGGVYTGYLHINR